MVVPEWLEAVAAGALASGAGEGRKDLRGRKKTVHDNAGGDDDEWGDGGGGAGGAAGNGGGDDDDEKWD